MQTGVYATAREAVPAILKNEGAAGLYSGFGVTVMREIPFSAIQFPIYEGLKVGDVEKKSVSSWVGAAVLCGCLRDSL